jgi:cyclopropane-fatty-acyl-phospholipid synthase
MSVSTQPVQLEPVPREVPFLGAVAKTQLDVLAVYNDRHSYFLTCKAWAENLEAARDEIIRRWGEPLYRRFRLYLWGSAYAFLNRGMEAYRVLLERPREQQSSSSA